MLRYITNKPQLNELSANVKAGYANTADGDDSYNFEGVVNIPLIDDKLAMRIVAYQDHRGGYIDNVYSTFTRQGTDLGFARRTGGVVPADSVVINNADIAGENINEVEYSGARASLKWQITDDWDALLAVAYQKIDGEGVFYQHPNGSESGCGANLQTAPTSTQRLKPLEVTVFNDGLHQGRVHQHRADGQRQGRHARPRLRRRVPDARSADRSRTTPTTRAAVWGTYYQCTGYLGRQSVDKCYSPSSFWDDKNDSTNMSHEIRLSSPTDWRMRFVGGLFYEDRTVEAKTDWHYKSVPECPDSGVVHGQLLPVPRSACRAEVPVGGGRHEQSESPRFGHRLLQRFHA